MIHRCPLIAAVRGAIAIAGCCLVLNTTHCSGESWAAYRGPAGDGVSTETLQSQSATPKLAVRWKVATPLGFSSLVINDGQVVTLIARDGREFAVSLDAATGEERWQTPLGTTKYNGGGGDSGAPNNRGGDGPRSTPAIDGDRVLIYDAHLKLWCLSLADGSIRWTRDVLEQHQGRNIKWSNASSPVVDEERVFVAGGGSGQSFLCLDSAGGEVVWSTGDDTMTHATPIITTIHGIRQVIYWSQSGLTALATDDGRVVWKASFPFSVSSAASPVVAGNRVYCSAGYGVGAGVFAIENKRSAEGEQSATEVWFEANELMNHWSTPVARENFLYGIYGFKKYARAPLQCVAMDSGQVRWSERGFGPGNCILVGEHLIVLSDAGELAIVAADPSKYRELARQKILDGKCWSTPAFADGSIYIRSTKQAARIDVH